MSLWSKVKGGLDIAQVCIEGIELIDSILKSQQKPDNAIDALKLVGNVIERVKAVLDEKISPDDVRSEFSAMAQAIRGGNADVDGYIDEQFDKS